MYHSSSVGLALFFAAAVHAQGDRVLLGSLVTRAHLVEGEVYLVSENVLEIEGFVYDGLGPAGFWWADTNPSPTSTGDRLFDSDPDGSCGETKLPSADGTGTYTVEFPEGTTINDYLGGSISVWCETARANFGEVQIPASLEGMGIVTADEGPALTCSSAVSAPTGDRVLLGSLVTRTHLVEGEVYMVSENVLEIDGFVYDGLGPAAFWWADTSPDPTGAGDRLFDSDPDGSCGETKLPVADGTVTYTVEFPKGTTINDYLGGSISVWCETAQANFGEVQIPDSLEGMGIVAADEGPALTCSTAPEVEVGALTTRQHDVAGTVVALSERVLEVRGFVFDGLGPAVYWWADMSAVPSDGGIRLLDGPPSGDCGATPVGDAADGSASYIVEFPEGYKLSDFAGGSISVWCEEFSANFGEVVIPATLEGVAATEDGPVLLCSDGAMSGTDVPAIAKTPEGYNCEELAEGFQVRWKVDGDNIAIELVGAIDETEYMGFGPSGMVNSTFMNDADPVIVDSFEGEFRARDFYMNDRSQCSGADGVCPDTELENAVDDVTDVSGERDLGVTLVRYKKALIPMDIETGTDTATSQTSVVIDGTFSVIPGETTFVVWAIGPVSPTTGFPQFHSNFPRDDVGFDFGREVVDNCEAIVQNEPPETMPTVEAFEVPVLRDTTEIVAHIGPSGGERGVQAITGMASWGIAWYLNDLLIPVVEMKRGTTYTFRVNGGDDPESNAAFHPFYLTSSMLGGYAQQTPADRAKEEIFAGITVTDTDADGGVVAFDSDVKAPICNYGTTASTAAALDGLFQTYFDSLDTSCQDDSSIIDAAAVLTFTPDEDTPDVIYYQCVTHQALGWKIKVLDADGTAGSSDDMTSAAVSLGLGASAVGVMILSSLLGIF